MSTTLWGFIMSGFNWWESDDGTLRVVRLGGNTYRVEWPKESREFGSRDLSWVRYNLPLNVLGLARNSNPEQPR